MKKHLLTLSTIAGLLCASLVPSQAAYTLRASADNGATWFAVSDNDPNDGDPTPGVINFDNALGNWIINVDTGYSKPYQGSPSDPFMLLGGVNLSQAAGTVIIQLSDTDFTANTVPRLFTNQVGGTTDGSVWCRTFIDKGNLLFGSTATYSDIGSAGVSPSPTAQVLTDTGNVFDSPFAVETVGNSSENGGAPFSLTLEIRVTHGDGFLVTSYGHQLETSPIPPVPSITVTKQVACLQPTNSCSDFGKIAEGFKSSVNPAFCYQITVTNSGTLTLTNVLLVDSMLGDITTNFFGTSGPNVLAPGQVAVAYFKMALDTTTTNLVIATALALNADGSGNSTVSSGDSAVAIVDKASLTSSLTVTSPCDLDGKPTNNCVLLPGCGEVCTVTFNLQICNSGMSDLSGVTVTSAALTQYGFSLPGPFFLAKGACTNIQYTISAACTNVNMSVNATANVTADTEHCGIYDITSTNIGTVNTSTSGKVMCAECRCTSTISGLVVLHCLNTDSNIVGNAGLANIKVTIYDASNNIVTNIFTDANGAFSNTNLSGGTYTVVVTPPAGYAQSYPNGTTNNTAVVVLGQCQTINNVNFGYQDQNLPVIKGIPAGGDLGCNPATAAIPTDISIRALVTASDDRGPITNIVVTHVDSTNGCGYSRVFTVRAYGTCGNIDGKTTYTWSVDKTVPVITFVPTGTNFGCNPAAAVLPTDASVKACVKATDNCGLASTNVSHIDTVTACGIVRVFTITVTDNCGNVSASKSVTYSWSVDTTLPVISYAPTGTNLGCNPAAASLPTDASIKACVKATDNCTLVLTNVTHVDVTSGCSVTRTFTIIAVDACNNNSLPKTVVYTWNVDKTLPVVNCPPDITLTNIITSYCTFTPGDYGASCNGTNAASILTNCFKKAYPGGVLQCGNGYNLKFTSGSSCRNFIPYTGKAGCLKGNYSNPTSCEAGSFAAHVLCLKLNVDLGDCKAFSGFSGCGDFILNDDSCSLDGKSVREILNICHTALGGGDVSGYGCNVSNLTVICSNLNSSFQKCQQSTWCKSHLIPAAITNISTTITGKATATDNCDNSPTITYVDTITCGACPGTFSIARKWSAVDDCGNVGTCTQNISIGNTKASVCGIVFTDCNGDGHLTRGIDPGTSNIVVTLKNANGVVVGTDTTDADGSYCFYNLTPGTYSVSIVQPTNTVQTAGCHTNHWMDDNGRDCWNENDGNQHWKGSDGVDCWNDNDGYSHWKGSDGRDCWKDKWGNSHSQACSYTSCNVPKGNVETFCLAACESKDSVNFAYKGVSSKVVCSVTGPTKGTCGQTATYTCTVTNTGNVCFTGGSVVICGKSYDCPRLSPGDDCKITCSYQHRTSDYGKFTCNANVYCNYTGSSSTCNSSSSCTTQVGW